MPGRRGKTGKSHDARRGGGKDAFPGPSSPGREGVTKKPGHGGEHGGGHGERKRPSSSAENPLLLLKLRAASELGLLDKVRRYGWGGLSAAESGRVGGYMTKLMRLSGNVQGEEPG